MTNSKLATQYEQPETLADELFGEDTATNARLMVDGSYIQYQENLNYLVSRIEQRTTTRRLFTSHPIYDVDDDEISIIGPNGARIMADKDWVNTNFATAGSVADSTARLDSLEYWQAERVRQDANTDAVITSLLQRIDRLERMIYNEK